MDPSNLLCKDLRLGQGAGGDRPLSLSGPEVVVKGLTLGGQVSHTLSCDSSKIRLSSFGSPKQPKEQTFGPCGAEQLQVP